MSVVLTPPATLPINNVKRSFDKTVRHDREYKPQKIRQNRFLPNRSAKEPTNVAEIAAETKPVVKRAATTLSARPFSSLYNV